jgi:EAL domain-containing protein (putative c-di-GMP-specific phosphodiesterase class I)
MGSILSLKDQSLQQTRGGSDILTLAKALNLPSIAEGIETPEQLVHLQTMNCALGQGYHLGAPMDSQSFIRRLRRRTPLAARH